MSKQNRQKGKQAKLQRRKQRQKQTRMPVAPSSSQGVLHDLMSTMQAEGGFSHLKQVINPPDHEKMSEVLGQYIAPYMDEAEDLEAMRKLVMIAVIAWNAAIMTEDVRETFLNQMLNAMPAEVREDAAYIIADLIRRKNRYFADNKRTIVNAQVTDIGEAFHIAVASLIPGDDT